MEEDPRNDLVSWFEKNDMIRQESMKNSLENN